MSWPTPSTILSTVEIWDVLTKVLAAVAVVTGPCLLVFLTRRGSRADRTAAERTEVEKLYISGSQDLIKHLQSSLVACTADLIAARGKCKLLQEEVDVANRSFTSFQDQYDRLVALLRKSGIPIPDEKQS